MIFFASDYNEGMHPRILEKLLATNLEQSATYGEDCFSEEARALIKKECGIDDLGVHFFVGGTQTNLSFIASALRSYEGVISSDEGHINVHETGAIECTGHKVLTLASVEGKIFAKDIEKICITHSEDVTAEHTVKPGMVYLSQPTEYGTLYTKSELEAISSVCKTYGLKLYVDGARMAFALTSIINDVQLSDLARLTDAFYIGGTKCGHFMGEALVISNLSLNREFRYIIKQRGAMLAKGRFLGLGFKELFTDRLYYKIGERANAQAIRIKQAFEKNGNKLFINSHTNQQFPIVSDEEYRILSNDFNFITWKKLEEGYIIRLVTSFATTDSQVDKLVSTIESF